MKRLNPSAAAARQTRALAASCVGHISMPDGCSSSSNSLTSRTMPDARHEPSGISSIIARNTAPSAVARGWFESIGRPFLVSPIMPELGLFDQTHPLCARPFWWHLLARSGEVISGPGDANPASRCRATSAFAYSGRRHMTLDPLAVSPREAAALLSISERGVWRLIRARKPVGRNSERIPPFRPQVAGPPRARCGTVLTIRRGCLWIERHSPSFARSWSVKSSASR